MNQSRQVGSLPLGRPGSNRATMSHTNRDYLIVGALRWCTSQPGPNPLPGPLSLILGSPRAASASSSAWYVRVVLDNKLPLRLLLQYIAVVLQAYRFFFLYNIQRIRTTYSAHPMDQALIIGLEYCQS